MRRLFVGGIWHGKVREVEREEPLLRVPVPPTLADMVASYDKEPSLDFPRSQNYVLERITGGGVHLKVYVLMGARGTSGLLAEALVMAAGLEHERL